MKRQIALACLLSCASAASAQFSIGDVVNVITAPVRVPVETGAQILRGGDAAAPLRGTVEAHGRVLSGSVDMAQRVHDQIASVPRSAVQNSLGGAWLSVYDTLTATQSIQTEMAFTQGRFLGGCLQGQPCTINQLVGLPLAASLRDAYKRYIGQSRPIDPSGQALLLRIMPANIVQNARVAFVGTPDMSVPGFLNSGNEIAGRGHAVTIGNLILFSRPVDMTDGDTWWVLHELHHVEQYARYSSNVMESIDGFAVDYLQYSGNMENEANDVATARLNQLRQSCQMTGC